MKFTDNIAAISHLKTRLFKWKVIAILAIISCFLLFLQHFLISSRDIANQGGDYIANITIDDTIFEDQYRSKILKEIEQDDSIKAVIVNVDSPGGGIVGSEILFNELRKIAQKKPMVTVMHSMAASGGYMISLASDYILAYNGTVTGSIGVILEVPEVTELASKIGVKFNNYKSSHLKGAPSPFEKSDAAVEKVINESIKDSYEFFVQLVEARRGQKLKDVSRETIFDGRIFTGRQALAVGLIDAIGGQDEALAYLNQAQKADTNLPVHNIDIIEKETAMWDKFLSALPFLRHLNSSSSVKGIMAL